MAVIDHSVVRIGPDFKGFRTALRNGLKQATAGITGSIKVKLVADSTGFRRSVELELKKVAPVTFKVKLVADGSGISGGSRSLKQRAVNAEREAGRAAARETLQAAKAAERERVQAVKAAARELVQAEKAAAKERVQAVKAGERERVQAIKAAEKEAAAIHREALAMDRVFNHQRTRANREELDSQRKAIAELKRVQAAQAQALREAAISRRELGRQFQAPKLVNFGGEGVKPLNLLYASLVALSPLLIGVASSAAQAGTSIFALGSAAYGGALAVTGLVAAFAGVFGALKLHAALQKAQQGQSAKTAAAEVSNAGSIRSAYESVLSAKEGVAGAGRQLIDAQAAEKKSIGEIAKAYQDAAQKVRDLRQQLSDLRVQQSGNAIDVAEAKRHQKEIESDFFATDLMKRQAGQDVAEAVQRGRDISADIGKTKTELSQRTKAGLGGSPEVVDAKDAAGKASRARQDAQSGLARAVRDSAAAQRGYTSALKGTTAATSGALAQDGQLQAALKDLSPAARNMYKWLIAHTEQFKRYKRSIEQAILPGFLSFLRDITAGSHSTVDVLVEGITGIGREISRTTANLGRLAKTAWFKGELAKLNKDNEKAFRNVGDAVVTVAKPIMRLFVAASPLIVRFTGYLNSLAHQFDTFIKGVGDAKLAAWFKSAGDELAAWWKIATNLGSFLLSVFQASLPSGNDLVARLGVLTGELAKWAKSDSGKQQLKDFFEFFKSIDYARIAQVAASVAALMTAWKLGSIVGKSPFYTFVALLATKWPDSAASVMERVADSAVGILSWVDKHPEQAATLLAVLSGLKLLNTVKPLGDIFGKIPGIGKLLSIFGDRGSTAANPLFVWGVNQGIGGGGGGRGTPPPPAAPGPKSPEGPTRGGVRGAEGGPGGVRGGELEGGAAVAALAAAWEIYDFVSQWRKDGKMPTFGDKNDNSTNQGFRRFFSMDISGGKYSGADDQDRLLFGTGWSGFGRRAKAGLPKWLGGGGMDIDAMKRQQGKAVGAEAAAWRNFKTAIDGGTTGILANNTATAAGNQGLQAYITSRKDSVKTIADQIRSTQGESAAQKFLQQQNERSKSTLEGVLTQLGWNQTAAHNYAEEIFGVPGTAKTEVKTPGLPTAQDNFTVLKEEIDPVTGVKTITLQLKNEKAVFADLRNTLIAQRVLSGTPEPEARRQTDKWISLQRAATGGYITGPGTETSDSIPALLSNREFVQNAKATKYYGTDVMQAMNSRSIPKEAFERFAGGGLVSAQNWPFPIDMSKTVIPQLSAPGTGVVSGDADVARIAEATARAMGASEKQLIALIETGLVESTMRNLSYGDKDSVGFLQQRPSQGWGSVKQIMDPAYATRKFIQKARRVDKGTFDAGQLAQAVQGSAYPYRYGKRYADAVAILNQAPPYVAGGGGGLGATPGGRGWKWQEDVLRQAFGKKVQFYSTTGGGHVPGSWHYKGRAVDLTPSMDIFKWIKSHYGGNTLELIYGPAGIGVRHGKPYNWGPQNAKHMNHVHWAYRDGGLVNAEKFDTGGVLNPGVTMAVNNTRKPETIRTYEQEQALHNGPVRIDRRDLALLAGYIVNAIAGQHIQMDGRKVAETVRGYDYMPRGI